MDRDNPIQVQKDRISEFPANVLDNIMGFLPIAEAARTAVLSRIWRDIWFNLTRLNFDCHFFDYMIKKYSNDCVTASFHIIYKVLLQNNGSILKFVFCLPDYRLWYGFMTDRSQWRWFDFEQWLLSVTRKGVEEIHLSFKLNRDDYRLPNCIFSCRTLKSLYLYGVSFEPIHAHSILPNVTSLFFEGVNFCDLMPHVANVPMLENLSFIQCKSISEFKITAPKLRYLTIKGCDTGSLMPPDTLDIRYTCTLDFDCASIKEFVEVYNMRDESTALNVGCLRLTGSSAIYSAYNISSDFIYLLQICPKLCKLDISLKCAGALSTSFFYTELYTVARSHKMLHTLKLSSFTGSISEMHLIKLLLDCFPALEKVIIFSHRKLSGIEEFDTIKELLRFPRVSKKAEIIYT
ncbi:PREDICTED: F-box/LRR-repeat protein At3g26922-like [Ipomoea nil]|uniref:F-box/LRR-repeat protein At3g26922-like n=1 Tax=Ipomoea nil TaxID=35883 RepID=UPI000900FC48|nr:PREDICTED: F-box/LRR-repeat protein At3g26922-like [Ipomoea nil]